MPGHEDRALFRKISTNGSRTFVSDFADASQESLAARPASVVSNAAGEVLVTDLDAGTHSRDVLVRVNPETCARIL
jgi:hypothetical protein